MCLKTYKNILVLSTCSPNKNEKSEMWKIDEETHLKNENNNCAQIAGNKLFSFTCNNLSTKEFEQSIFSSDELYLMKTRYSQQKLKNIKTEDIDTFHNNFNTLTNSYKEVDTKIVHILNRDKEMKKQKEKILHLINDMKLLVNTSSSLNEYGTGAIMKIYDNMDIEQKKYLLNVPLEKLEINEEKLDELGIEQGQIKIIIQSFLNVPENNTYTFYVKNIVGYINIKLNNEEILSNRNIEINNRTNNSAVVKLRKNKLIPIYIEISSIGNEKPSFSLYWSNNNNMPEQIINSLYLYSTIYEKVCYTPLQKKIDFTLTFENITKTNREYQFLCPLKNFNNDQNVRILKNENRPDYCYDLKSSICASAIDSYFLPNESEGIVKAVRQRIQNEKGIYEECGIILPTNTTEHIFKGITDIKLIDMDDFFINYEKNKELYKGYKGIVTDDKHSLLSKTDLDKSFISDIDINCTNNFNEKKTNYEYSSGSFIIKRIKSSDLLKQNTSIVVDVFALFEKYSDIKNMPSIYLSNWGFIYSLLIVLVLFTLVSIFCSFLFLFLFF